MHTFLQDVLVQDANGRRILSDGSTRELYVGDVFVEAMKAGFTFDHVMFEDGYTTDIGTHEEMTEYLRKNLGQ